MAEGGQEIAEGSMENIIKSLEKPSNLQDVKEKIPLLKNVRPEKRKLYEEKVTGMIEEKENIEQKLTALAENLYKNAKKDLPKELETVLKSIRNALAEKPEEEPDEDTEKAQARPTIATPPPLSERPVVWALEMGDTYTSYAFSLDVSGDLRIGIHYPELLFKKTSTAILLDSERNFKFFGYEAEEEYARMVEAEKEKNYYFFKSFPIVLRSCLKLGRSSLITEETGRSLEAQLVFTLSIKYFVDLLIQRLKSESSKTSIDDVNFVITVPASSDDTVSQFVTDAAIAAGIKKDQVRIVLEPVAASVYCQRADSYNTEKECFRPATGEKYLVADLGGDSSKFTVQIKKREDELDSVVSVTFCPSGGNLVNEEFFEILEDAFGDDIWDLLKTKHAESYLYFLRQFDIAKRNCRSEIKITFPKQLDDISHDEYGRSVYETLSDQEYGIRVSGQTLLMEREKFQKLFRPTLNALKKEIKGVLSLGENKDIGSILMVGGFSESGLVQKEMVGHINQEFPQHKVFIPKEPELAILKGAVFCGCLPYTIKGDMHKCTFGVQNWLLYDPEKHQEEEKVIVGETAYCKGGFSTFAQKGQRFKVGDTCTKLFIALESDADYLLCEIYASNKPNPQFTRECILQGTIRIKLPKIKPENLIIEEKFHFGETEMNVTARDIYLKKYDVKCSYQMRIQE